MIKGMLKISARQISGQVGIIVILITAAVITFSLSIANRVVQENKVVIDRSDSIRTFNFAEDGIDAALNKIYQHETSGTSLPTSPFSTDPLNQVSIESSQTFTGYLNQGEILRIDLSPTFSGNINLKWSKNPCTSTYKVALLLTNLYLDTTYQSNYYLVGQNNLCVYNNNQNVIQATETLSNEFKYTYSLAVTAHQDSSLYIQTVGSGTDIQVSGSIANLITKAQYEIDSRAKSVNDISNKTIEASKSVPSAPGFMTFALFSGGAIVK